MALALSVVASHNLGQDLIYIEENMLKAGIDLASIVHVYLPVIRQHVSVFISGHLWLIILFMSVIPPYYLSFSCHGNPTAVSEF